MTSIADRFAARPAGFTALRLFLAGGIVLFHSITVAHGNADMLPAPMSALFGLIVPAFFAVSGFLVAASLKRTCSVPRFLGLRLLRLAPALTVVVLATMLVLGPLLTHHHPIGYFASPATYAYLSNLAMAPAYGLPGLFEVNPRAGIVNGSLWTIPYEVQCYLLLAAAGLAGLLRSVLPAASLLLLALLAILAGIALPDGTGLLLAFLSGVLLFLLAPRLPLHRGLASACLLLAFALALHPDWRSLAGIPLAYGAVWLGCCEAPRLPGDYSYGLYLVGYPLQQALIQLFPGAWWQNFAMALPLGLLLAALLWHGIEAPVLRRKHALLAIRRGNEKIPAGARPAGPV